MICVIKYISNDFELKPSLNRFWCMPEILHGTLLLHTPSISGYSGYSMKPIKIPENWSWFLSSMSLKIGASVLLDAKVRLPLG